MITSRLRRPMSESMTTTLWPRMARPVPILAVAVVLPTPPLPEVITIVLPFIKYPSGVSCEPPREGGDVYAVPPDVGDLRAGGLGLGTGAGRRCKGRYRGLSEDGERRGRGR